MNGLYKETFNGLKINRHCMIPVIVDLMTQEQIFYDLFFCNCTNFVSVLILFRCNFSISPRKVGPLGPLLLHRYDI